jgi:hypothetical protein
MAVRYMLINKATRAQAHARVREPISTYTHKYIVLVPFPRQQWLRERSSMLRYTYVVSLHIDRFSTGKMIT